MTHRDEDEEIIDTALDTLAWQRREIDQLREALLDVLVYAPDYMHGMPKKHYEKIALGEKP